MVPPHPNLPLPPSPLHSHRHTDTQQPPWTRHSRPYSTQPRMSVTVSQAEAGTRDGNRGEFQRSSVFVTPFRVKKTQRGGGGGGVRLR